MRKLIFASIFVSMSPLSALAQDVLVIKPSSAGSAGAGLTAGVVFGGVSMASVAVASALIAALVAFMVEENSAVSSTSTTN